MISLFLTFLKIGLFTIGGGYSTIALVADTVKEYGWMAMEHLTDLIGISESTPGPIAVNLATFVGYEQYGVMGSFLATLGVVLPSFIIMFFIAKYSAQLKNNFCVQGAFTGLRPAVLGLIISSVYLIAVTTFIDAGVTGFSALKWKSVIIFGILFMIKFVYRKIHPAALIGIAAALGIVLYGIIP